MSRPQNKEALLEFSKDNYNKLLEFIESFSTEEQTKKFPEWTRDRNIRDVLVHLHEWHLMMWSWYEDWMNWIKPEMPAKWYTWKTTAEMNLQIWKKYQNTSLQEAKKMLNHSFSLIRDIIKYHTDDELFEKRKYNWTWTTSLWAYLVSATSSHYDWAYKLIKKAKKSK